MWSAWSFDNSPAYTGVRSPNDTASIRALEVVTAALTLMRGGKANDTGRSLQGRAARSRQNRTMAGAACRSKG
jgi:hypothetical protein